MTSTAAAPPAAPPSAPPAAPPSAPPSRPSQPSPLSPLLRFYARVPTPVVDAMAVTLLSLELGIFRTTTLLGRPPFSWQLLSVLLGLTIIPSFTRHSLHVTISKWLLLPVILLWTITSFLPVFYVMVVELFTGHRRQGMQWYNSVWRVYAILFLWILISVLIEHYLKPLWRRHLSPLFSAPRGSSVVVKGYHQDMRARDAKLQSLRDKYQLLMRRRTRLSALITKKRALLLPKHPSPHPAHDVDTASTCLHDQDDLLVVREELVNLTTELDDVDDVINLTKIQWAEALHVDSHRRFYR